MAQESSNNGRTIVIAAIAGGLVGAVVGLLVAPKSGKELRQDISSKAKETWDKVDLVEEGRELVSSLRGLVDDIRGGKGHGSAIPETKTVEAAAAKDEA